MAQTISIVLYKTAAFTDDYSQDGSFSDPIWPRQSITWDGDAGEVKDIQIYVRNDGDVEAFGVSVEMADIDGSDETTWSKLATTQAGLPGAAAGNSLALGDLAVNATTNFWLRVQVPVDTDPESKTDLRVRTTASLSSSSSSSSESSSSSSSSSSSAESVSSSSSSQSPSSSSSSSESSSSSSSTATGVAEFSRGFAVPDQLQAEQSEWPVFPVESEIFPNGITLTGITIRTDGDSTYSVTLKEFTSPGDGSPSTIVTIATAASDTAATNILTDAIIAAGSIIFVTLDTDDISWVEITGTYFVN